MHQNRKADSLRQVAFQLAESHSLQQHASLTNGVFNKQRIAIRELHARDRSVVQSRFAIAGNHNFCQIVFARLDQITDELSLIHI